MSYQEALEALRKAKPDHVLLRILSMQQTEGNRLILDRELEKLEPPEDETPALISEVDASIEVEIEDGGDAVLADFYRQQATLFGQRRKMSNSFHSCGTDSERREVSEAIQAVQRRIEHVRQQMREYKTLGHVPAANEKYPVPEDAFKLLALRASLRSNISRKSKEAKELALKSLENDAQATKKLTLAEMKLRELQNHLERVQKSIHDKNIQPGRLREG